MQFVVPDDRVCIQRRFVRPHPTINRRAVAASSLMPGIKSGELPRTWPSVIPIGPADRPILSKRSWCKYTDKQTHILGASGYVTPRSAAGAAPHALAASP
ncbi:hypothetical protein EVAR_18733_1 [Eumeta japonica]|uniref:Uncharacterized protein n=1 Tax=Eumeta variegata TaxID=151549 RepID=A0A4C1UMY8_EUMVA|nr:hypothetical protein EVAR_18733_1 [Eumeta japonica]